MVFSKWPLLAIAAVCATLASGLAHAAPRVQFDKETLQFGKVRSGAPIKATFTVRNAGDTDLQITGVKPGCGCTKAGSLKTTLAPNESTTIEAVFDSTGFTGPINKDVAVSTNDPDRSTVTLMIQADILPLAEVTPATLSFGDLRRGAMRTYTLTVRPVDPATFTIAKADASGSHVRVTGFRKVPSPAGAYWEVFVIIKAGTTPGRVLEAINIETNGGETAKLNVTAYGNVTK